MTVPSAIKSTLPTLEKKANAGSKKKSVSFANDFESTPEAQTQNGNLNDLPGDSIPAIIESRVS